MHTRSRIAGFTLVELLVVISIVALLISMLLPAIGKAKDTAVAATCQSQLRQCFIAINGYATDRQGALPAGYSASCSSLPKYSADYLIAYLSNNPSAGQGASFNAAAYRKPMSVFYCPVSEPTFGPAWGPSSFGIGVMYPIAYYYMGNPVGLSPTDVYYIDRGKPGLQDDVLYSLYTNKSVDNHVVLLVDFSGQSTTQNWITMHPYKQDRGAGTNNVLFGDGAVTTVQRKDFISRWYSPNPIGW